MEKVQLNSIDKKQNGLKYSKNNKSSTLPRGLLQSTLCIASAEGKIARSVTVS